MQRCCFPLLVIVLLAGTVQSEEPAPEIPPALLAGGHYKSSDLQFIVEGKDLLIRLVVEGPAARQAVLTDYTIFDGTPPWDEPPIGVTKPRRQPRIELRCLVLVNESLPGFIDKGLLNVPTPQEERQRQAQEVIWRLPNYENWGFRREEAVISVEVTRFAASSEQLRNVLPRIKQTIEEAERVHSGPAP